VDVAPRRDADIFSCPFCGVFATQRWEPFVVGYESKGSKGAGAWWGIGREAGGIAMSFCENCRQAMVWRGDDPIWPLVSSAPTPSLFMPDEVHRDFDEARQVFDRSPRSCAALLRLAVQSLCRHLGRPGDDVGVDIEALVGNGLPASVWKLVDTARLVGDDAVPPGVLDGHDGRETAIALFDLIDVMVDKMIAEPARWRRT
jgi:Domain of unknown function (DUF4145)